MSQLAFRGSVTKMPRAEQWADRIQAQQKKSVESVLEVGRLLIKAKADITPGEWGRLFDENLVSFGQRTAQRLMEVASHPILSNATHGSHLPPSWRTLYELTKAEPSKLKNALKDGVITPDMPRKAVKALLPGKPGMALSKQQELETTLNAVRKQLDRLWDNHPDYHSSILATLSSWNVYFAQKG